jgi:hypothetical protein
MHGRFITLLQQTHSKSFMADSQPSRPHKTKTQALYLASSNEIEHSFAEGGLHWLDE